MKRTVYYRQTSLISRLQGCPNIPQLNNSLHFMNTNEEDKNHVSISICRSNWTRFNIFNEFYNAPVEVEGNFFYMMKF